MSGELPPIDWDDLCERAITSPEPSPNGHGSQGSVRADKRAEDLLAQIVDSEGLRSLPKPEWLVDRVLYVDSLAWLIGPPGSAKSFLAIDWAACIATGLPWNTWHEVRKGNVLYIAAEGGRGLSQRIDAWEDRFGQKTNPALKVLPTSVGLFRNDVDLSAMKSVIDKLQPALLVIDTQARATVGANENDAGDMGVYIDNVEQLRQVCGSGVLNVHHSNRNGEYRGSSAIEGAAQTMASVTKDGSMVRLDFKKDKDNETPAPMQLKLEPFGKSAVLVPVSRAEAAATISGAQSRVLYALQHDFPVTGASQATLAEHLEVHPATVSRQCNALAKLGQIQNRGTDARPHWIATSIPAGDDE